MKKTVFSIGPSVCQKDQFYCNYLDKCISQNLICDGCIDCPLLDDSEDISTDERNCISKSKMDECLVHEIYQSMIPPKTAALNGIH